MCHERQYFFFLLVVFLKRLDSLSVNFISDIRFSIKVCGYPLSIERFLKFAIFSSKVVSAGELCSWDSQGFCFDKSLFNNWRMTRGEMSVLEGFCWFKMCLYSKDRFFAESCARCSQP